MQGSVARSRLRVLAHSCRNLGHVPRVLRLKGEATQRGGRGGVGVASQGAWIASALVGRRGAADDAQPACSTLPRGQLSMSFLMSLLRQATALSPIFKGGG